MKKLLESDVFQDQVKIGSTVYVVLETDYTGEDRDSVFTEVVGVYTSKAKAKEVAASRPSFFDVRIVDEILY